MWVFVHSRKCLVYAHRLTAASIYFNISYICVRLVNHTRAYIKDNLPGGVCFARSQKGWIVKHKNANGKWAIKKVFCLNAEKIKDLAIPQMHYMHSDPHEPIHFVSYVPLCANIHRIKNTI